MNRQNSIFLSKRHFPVFKKSNIAYPKTYRANRPLYSEQHQIRWTNPKKESRLGWLNGLSRSFEFHTARQRKDVITDSAHSHVLKSSVEGATLLCDNGSDFEIFKEYKNATLKNTYVAIKNNSCNVTVQFRKNNKQIFWKHYEFWKYTYMGK